MIRTYSKLCEFDTFEERFRYLSLDGVVGRDTFGFDRYLNQLFYKSPEWKRTRQQIIVRDNGCDLGLEGFEIGGKILIHHLNPITAEDISDRSDLLMNPEYLVCVSHNTHNAIHYGDESMIISGPVIRMPNDMCPWKRSSYDKR